MPFQNTKTSRLTFNVQNRKSLPAINTVGKNIPEPVKQFSECREDDLRFSVLTSSQSEL